MYKNNLKIYPKNFKNEKKKSFLKIKKSIKISIFQEKIKLPNQAQGNKQQNRWSDSDTSTLRIAD